MDATATRILLQTTIPLIEDDWNIGRFSRLAAHLASLDGVEVETRDSTVDEPPGDAILRDPEGLRQTRAYMTNLARWLS